jgi:hypothetical protein
LAARAQFCWINLTNLVSQHSQIENLTQVVNESLGFLKAASPQSEVSFQLANCYETQAGSLRHLKNLRTITSDAAIFNVGS